MDCFITNEVHGQNCLFSLPYRYMELDELIGKNLQRLRERNCLTQEQLAEKIGIESPGLISRWENGKKGIGKAVLKKLSESLHASPWEFLIADDTPVVTDSGEWEMLMCYRQAKLFNRAGEAARAVKFVITEAIIERGDREGKEGSADRPKGTATKPRRIKTA